MAAKATRNNSTFGFWRWFRSTRAGGRSRRGQILSFEAKAGWEGRDEASRSQCSERFEWRFDHLQELSSKLADDIIAA